MSAKITSARRAAFLKSLAATGNLSLSAERAKLSLSWVRLHRAQDAEFDAACGAAIAGAKAGLRPSTTLGTNGLNKRGAGWDGTRRPPAGWGFAAGVELVVSGSNGRRTQVRRAKLRQWTPRVERRFLEALAATCNVKAAAREAGMSHSSAYAHRQRWPAFARHWDDAIEVGYAVIETALIEGAIRFMEGEPPELGGPIRVTSVAEAIQALNMNKFAVKGTGKAPGKR